MANRMQAIRPMRDLLERLPKLPMTCKQQIDFAGADPALLAAIGQDAETTMRAVYLGLGAIGCQRRLNIDPPCRTNIDPGRVAGV